MEEIWKDVPNYEGLYKASTLGQIASYDRIRRHGRFIAGRIMNPTISTRGYFDISLYDSSGKEKRISVARLIAITFISNPDKKLTINHKNGIKTDNRVENLEWMSYSENVKHAYDNGLALPVRGEQNGQTKLTTEKVLQIKELLKAGNLSQYKIAAMFEVGRGAIQDIKRGKNWKHI
jgi:predicted XRE-type DNA-binding protein